MASRDPEPSGGDGAEGDGLEPASDDRGDEAPRGRRPLWDEEPFATIRAHPRRFGIGTPLAFVVSIGAALPLVERSLSLAVAVQLFIQTVALLWLYLPVARRRWDAEREHRSSDEGQPGR